MFHKITSYIFICINDIEYSRYLITRISGISIVVNMVLYIDGYNLSSYNPAEAYSNTCDTAVSRVCCSSSLNRHSFSSDVAYSGGDSRWLSSSSERNFCLLKRPL